MSIISAVRDYVLGAPIVKEAPPVPSEALDAMVNEGLDFGSAFGPGTPLTPFQGLGGEARRFEFPTGYNIISRADRDKRVSFDVLKGLIDNYDIARMAIGHRIDDVRSLEWSLQPARGFKGDVEAVTAAGYAVLKHPEGPGSHMMFRPWLAKFLEDVLRYDAGCLFRRRDRAGRVIGLKVVSGRTMAPTLDYWGDTPSPPAPAYVQFVQGLPWKWFTSNDIIYAPFRPQPDSVYGFAPLEAVLLTANTDLRFQMYFLNSFTQGTVPEGFMSAPEGTSSPDQLMQLQEYWDALLYGDESAKHQLKMVPFGTEFNFPTQKDFDDKFPIYMMRKVAAAYHVTPNDLGFTDDVNRSSSEAQIDVQNRIGTMPLVQFVQDILSAYLQDDLGIPLDFVFDAGEEKEDRISTATAHKLYVEMGAESVDEVRSAELGLPIDNENPMPRFIYSQRTGPVPLTSLYAIAGAIDPETGGPRYDVPLELNPFEGTAALLADKPIGGGSFKRAPQNPDEPGFPELQQPVPGTEVPTPAPPAPASAPAAPVAKSADSSQVFARFVKGRLRSGTWRDFDFGTGADPVRSHRFNQFGASLVRKANGEVVAAGLCIQAADTGRVLMLQRCVDPSDPASGQWEFPGGCLDPGEDAQTAALREWSEEVGLAVPAGTITGGWTSANGVYVGFVETVASEADLPILSGRDLNSNPDDLDGDLVEAISWWDPQHMINAPGIRTELASDMTAVLGQLQGSGDEVVKSAEWDAHPVRKVEGKLAEAHAPAVQSALATSISREQLRAVVAAYIAAQPDK